MTTVSITYVKKILEDGEPCTKCKQTDLELAALDHHKYISNVEYANVNDEDSRGWKLAYIHEADSAPFFIVYYHTDKGMIPELFDSLFLLTLSVLDNLDSGAYTLYKELN